MIARIVSMIDSSRNHNIGIKHNLKNAVIVTDMKIAIYVHLICQQKIKFFHSLIQNYCKKYEFIFNKLDEYLQSLFVKKPNAF